MNRKRLRFNTDEGQALRMLSLTATDWNTLFTKEPNLRGGNKYRNLTKLTRQKLGHKKKIEGPALDHGVFYEPEALHVYTLVTGNELVEEEVGFCRGPGPEHSNDDYIMHEWIGATPDGVCKYTDVLVETKCPFWKRLIEGGVPDIYWTQIMVQMAVTGIHRLHFTRYLPPSLTDPGHIDIIEIKFDRKWWSKAVKVAHSFWEDLQLFVKGARPCPPSPISRPRKKKQQKVSPTMAIAMF